MANEQEMTRIDHDVRSAEILYLSRYILFIFWKWNNCQPITTIWQWKNIMRRLNIRLQLLPVEFPSYSAHIRAGVLYLPRVRNEFRLTCILSHELVEYATYSDFINPLVCHLENNDRHKIATQAEQYASILMR